MPVCSNTRCLASEVRCIRCEWTSVEDLAAVKAAGPRGGYDVILGADICYGQRALPAVRLGLQRNERVCTCAEVRGADEHRM